MAERSRQLTLRFSRRAEQRLLEIWQWTAERFGDGQANEYYSFLRESTVSLSESREHARRVSKGSRFHYQTLRNSNRGNGHVVVFEVRPDEVFVFDYFHTAQDWRANLSDHED